MSKLTKLFHQNRLPASIHHNLSQIDPNASWLWKNLPNPPWPVKVHLNSSWLWSKSTRINQHPFPSTSNQSYLSVDHEELQIATRHGRLGMAGQVVVGGLGREGGGGGGSEGLELHPQGATCHGHHFRHLQEKNNTIYLTNAKH